MLIWLDNHLSPSLATWITQTLGHDCAQIRDLGMARARDIEIFAAARDARATFVTKDTDFAELVLRLGPPPAVIHLTCGNTSDAFLRVLFATVMPKALALISAGEPLVEISAP